MKKKHGVAETVNSFNTMAQKFTVQHPNCELFSGRIKVLLSEIDNNAAELARRIDVKDTTVRKWRDGVNEPARKSLAALADEFDVSLEWLVSGRGPMRPRYVEQPGFDDEYAQVPLYNVSVSAGDGALNEHEEPIGRLAFGRWWLRQVGLAEQDLVAITARGDSMEPTISDADMLLIDTSQRDVGIEGVFVLVMNGWLVVKRVQRLPGGSVRVLSDNRRYDPIDMDVADMAVTGRVVWVGHTL